MSIKDNKKNINKSNNFPKIITIFIIIFLVLFLVSAILIAKTISSTMKNVPDIEPTEINSTLDQTSFIYDKNGNLIEKIDAAEHRTFVSIQKMPKHLKYAFISIEDERFYQHRGIDPKGIMVSLVDNIKAGRIVRGASTITQQLAKNVYLSNEKKLSRKLTEAYIAFHLENDLTKDQILEAYLNRNFFGNNAYGVQEAAQTYFAKNVEDLSIAESAMLAGVVKSTSKFQPYKRVKPDDFNEEKDIKIGETEVLGEKYFLVFNDNSINRQKIVLKKMKELGHITPNEYKQALNEDIISNLKPADKKMTGMTSYFSDFVKSETIKLLQSNLKLTYEEAEEMLFTGGLKIYSTIDINMQKELEDVYNNFSEILLGNTSYYNAPLLINWRLDSNGNIIDDKGQVIYYKEFNLMDEDYNLFIEKGTYNFNDNGDLIINNPKLNIYKNNIDIVDYYKIDDRKNLVTHTVGSIQISNDDFNKLENGELLINSKFLNKNKNFFNINDNGHLIISKNYFFRSTEGAVQPQSASVIMDHTNGEIKAVVGGRELDGTKILNRATNSPRQPGSVIKPISVYLPALDNGYTAASGIEDAPLIVNGKEWPRNWYLGYRGYMTLRTSVEQSVNVNTVKVLQDIGYDTSKKYLSKLGIIDNKNPNKDNFITKKENPNYNDENPSALALGGMSKGLTPLELTAAYGAIANNGVYIEPTPIVKILDRDDDLLIDNKTKKVTVVSPEVAYIMKDILRTTVTNGLAKEAQVPGMATAGKTGTTQHTADIWFVGFTPYYVSAVWIGNDSPAITINQTSIAAARLWRNIMTRAHKGLDSKSSFIAPKGLVRANVCSLSGKVPTGGCQVINELFVPGTIPNTYCNLSHSSYIPSTPEENTDTDLDSEEEENIEDNETSEDNGEDNSSQEDNESNNNTNENNNEEPSPEELPDNNNDNNENDE